jgi:hypothetical protein
MAKIADRAEMMIRLDYDLKRWVVEQAALDASSQNSVLVRALRLMKAESERRAA